MSSNDAKSAPRDIVNINTAAGVPDVWLKTQMSPLWNKNLFPDYDAMLRNTSKLAGSVLTDSTMNRMMELTDKMASVAALKFPNQHLDALEKLISQATGFDRIAKQISDQHDAIAKMIDPSINMLKMMGYEDRLYKSVEAMTTSFAASIDTSHFQDILANASALREEFTDQDLEEIDDFFETHPDLAETIEDVPGLHVLSQADRLLVIWFVRICVTLSVTCIMLNISIENPQLDALLDAIGMSGGWEMGKKAGHLTGKALDKLPQEKLA
jgi:hypothetical protein